MHDYMIWYGWDNIRFKYRQYMNLLNILQPCTISIYLRWSIHHTIRWRCLYHIPIPYNTIPSYAIHVGTSGDHYVLQYPNHFELNAFRHKCITLRNMARLRCKIWLDILAKYLRVIQFRLLWFTNVQSHHSLHMTIDDMYGYGILRVPTLLIWTMRLE